MGLSVVADIHFHQVIILNLQGISPGVYFIQAEIFDPVQGRIIVGYVPML
jgi:hypothetical protein